MASKQLFGSSNNVYTRGPLPDATNEAGGKAFSVNDEAALAKMSLTGTLGNTFYINAETQLDKVLSLADKVSPKFLAQTAIFARQKGFMKDIPALLLAKLASRESVFFKSAFPRVCDNAKMVRNFVQIIRSGKAGRKSLGSAPKKQIQNFLNNLSDRALLNASVGDSPSLEDIIKLTHPKPKDEKRRAFYGHLIGKEGIKTEDLPEIVQNFQKWKTVGLPDGTVPEIDFRLLTSFALTETQWRAVAEKASWQTLRQGLNMFKRHGAFDNKDTLKTVVSKLENRDLIERARVFPYQLMAAYINIEQDMPAEIRAALERALEISTENTPSYDGQVYVFNDISGSMADAITGSRPGATSKMRCVDVAALIAACVQRKNPSATIIPFNDSIKNVKINSQDSILNNARALAGLLSGGTNCGAPLAHLNGLKANGDLCIMVSDNQSWFSAYSYHSTSTQAEWLRFKDRNPKAKLVCIDLTPGSTVQAKDAPDVLNVAGFSDVVFDVIRLFTNGQLGDEHLVSEIKQVLI